MSIGKFENNVNESNFKPETNKELNSNIYSYNHEDEKGKLKEPGNCLLKEESEKEKKNDGYDGENQKLQYKDNFKNNEFPYNYKFQENDNFNDLKLNGTEKNERFDSKDNPEKKLDDIINDSSLSKKEKIDKLKALRSDITSESDNNGDDIKSAPDRILGKGPTLEDPYVYKTLQRKHR